jgi:hypothetical protein
MRIHVILNTDPGPLVQASDGCGKGEHVGFQTTGEAFRHQKRTSSTSKHELSYFLKLFLGHYCPSGSGSSQPISNPDPDPQH